MQMKFTANPDLAQPPTVGMRGLVSFAVFHRSAINGVVPDGAAIGIRSSTGPGASSPSCKINDLGRSSEFGKAIFK
jgi:hypothetical protein